MAKYDVIIIGSGLGGLECGAILSQEGYNVCVLEKNHAMGGCLQTFRRGGHSLDTGIHYMGSLDDGQILNQYFRYLGVMDSLRLAKMDSDAFDTVILEGREYGLGMGYDRFAAGLKECFPSESDNIDRYCALLKSIGNTMSVDKLRRGIISEGAMPYIESSAFDALNRILADPVLRSVASGTSLLYAGDKEKTTLYHYGMINHSFIESSYRFVGGSGQLADALSGRIRTNGGVVLTGKEVTAIRTVDSRASGVETSDGEFFESDYVISDVHPAVTFGLVEPTPRIRKAYITRFRSLENSYGVFSVYLVMKKDVMPYYNSNFYLYEDSDTWQQAYDMERDKPRCVLFNMQAGSSGQEYADVVSLLCPITFEPFVKWENTLPERRGDEYTEFKARLAERIIDFAAHRFPRLREAIDRVYTTSPLSYRDYTATPCGSVYGIVKDRRSPLTTLVQVNTRLENLLLTGQNMNVHGALGVTVTAALTCAELLGKEYLAKKIGNA